MTDRTKRQQDFYEVIDPIKSEDGYSTLSASFTPNNGLRVMIRDGEGDPHWHNFDFTTEQAELIGQALVRWAQRQRAETEMIRCWSRMP